MLRNLLLMATVLLSAFHSNPSLDHAAGSHFLVAVAAASIPQAFTSATIATDAHSIPSRITNCRSSEQFVPTDITTTSFSIRQQQSDSSTEVEHSSLPNTRHSARELLQQFEEEDGASSISLEVSITGSKVTVVSTAQQLKDAVEDGAMHIEIQEHISLVELKGGKDDEPLLSVLSSNTKSIRGNCTSAVPIALALSLDSDSAPLQSLKPGQCLVVSDWSVFGVVGTRVWLQGLYIRMVESREGPKTPISELIPIGQEPGRLTAGMWMNDVTLQGNGGADQQCEWCGLRSSNANVYAQGWTVVRTEGGTTASFVNCTFQNNTMVAEEEGAAVMMQAAWSGEDEVGAGGSLIRLERCTFANNLPNSLPELLVDSRGTLEATDAAFYSDAHVPLVCTYEGTSDSSEPAACKGVRAKLLSEAEVGLFSRSTDAWLLTVQQEISTFRPTLVMPTPPTTTTTTAQPPLATSFPQPFNTTPVVGPPSTPTANSTATDAASSNVPTAAAGARQQSGVSEFGISPGGDAGQRWEKKKNRKRTILIAAVCTVAAAAVIGLLLSGIYANRRGRKRRAAALPYVTSKATFAKESSHNAKPVPPPASGNSNQHSTTSNHTFIASDKQRDVTEYFDSPPETRQGARSLALGSATRSSPTLTQGTPSMSDVFGTGSAATSALLWSPRKTPPQGTPGQKSIAASMRYIHQQLDCFTPERLLLHRYQLLGRKERRTGGQGVIQFARKTDGPAGAAYAIKFFARYAAFKEEAAIYHNAPEEIRRFMPTIVNYASNEDGALRDPFGNPMPAFLVMEKGECLSEHSQKAPASQVLASVSARISELHDAGYVHRDLKPGNVMWLPRESRWVLIDFGMMSKIGKRVVIGFTPAYAAPEVLKESKTSSKCIVADAAVDAWSLGVIAFELLTGSAPFRSTREVYEDVLNSGCLLPWEDGAITEDSKADLGQLHKPILRLLERDPKKRISVHEFSRHVQDAFGHSTSFSAVATDTSAAADAASQLDCEIKVLNGTDVAGECCEHSATGETAFSNAAVPREIQPVCEGVEPRQQNAACSRWTTGSPANVAAAADASAPLSSAAAASVVIRTSRSAGQAGSSTMFADMHVHQQHTSALPSVAPQADPLHASSAAEHKQAAVAPSNPFQTHATHQPPPRVASPDMHAQHALHLQPAASSIPSDALQPPKCSSPQRQTTTNGAYTAIPAPLSVFIDQQQDDSAAGMHSETPSDGRNPSIAPMHTSVTSTRRNETNTSTDTASTFATSILSAPPTFFGQNCAQNALGGDSGMRGSSGGPPGSPIVCKMFMSAHTGGSAVSDRSGAGDSVQWKSNWSFVTCESSIQSLNYS